MDTCLTAPGSQESLPDDEVEAEPPPEDDDFDSPPPDLAAPPLSPLLVFDPLSVFGLVEPESLSFFSPFL